MTGREYWAAYRAERNRLDARRNCVTGYSCGSSCIPVKKECQKESGSSIGKERLNKIRALASGAAPEGRGVMRLRQQEAAGLAEQIQSRRSQRATELKSGRSAPSGSGKPTRGQQEQLTAIAEGVKPTTGRAQRGREVEEQLKSTLAGMAASDRDLFRNAGRAISEMQAGISRLAEMEGVDLSDVRPSGSGRVTSSTPQAIEGGGKTREQIRREKGLDLAQGEQRGLDLGIFGSGSTPLFGSEAFVPGAGQQPAPKPDEVEYKRFNPRASRIPREPKPKTSPNAKPLPKGVTDQVKAVSNALREAKTPLTAQEVRALFKGKTAIVPDILNALTVAGGLQEDGQGRYFYPVYTNNIVGR